MMSAQFQIYGSASQVKFASFIQRMYGDAIPENVRAHWTYPSYRNTHSGISKEKVKYSSYMNYFKIIKIICLIYFIYFISCLYDYLKKYTESNNVIFTLGSICCKHYYPQKKQVPAELQGAEFHSLNHSRTKAVNLLDNHVEDTSMPLLAVY